MCCEVGGHIEIIYVKERVTQRIMTQYTSTS